MKELHPWTVEPAEGVRIQASLRESLVLEWDGRDIETVGGVDMSVREDQAKAAIVILRFPDLKPLEAVTADVHIEMPYISGLLAFREGPAVLAAWEKLETRPDLLMFDGQGIAHPRGVGIASQMGLWLDLPTIGVAKSRLYGYHEEPGPKRGEFAWLYHQKQRDKVVGAVLRTRDNVKPLYVSPGHLIDVENSINLVLACGGKYRLPETTGWAHKVAGGAELPQDDGQLSLF